MAAALAALTIAPIAAHGATVGGEGHPLPFGPSALEDLTYRAGPGEHNKLTVVVGPDTMPTTLYDGGAKVTPLTWCEGVYYLPRNATCLRRSAFVHPGGLVLDTSFDRISVLLRDGNNRVTIEGDALRGMPDSEWAFPEGVRVIGGPGDDVISAGPSDARIVTGGGNDRIDAGPGDDVIHAQDGFVDHIACGPGDDVVYADPFDLVADDCETVIVD